MRPLLALLCLACAGVTWRCWRVRPTRASLIGALGVTVGLVCIVAALAACAAPRPTPGVLLRCGDGRHAHAVPVSPTHVVTALHLVDACQYLYAGQQQATLADARGDVALLSLPSEAFPAWEYPTALGAGPVCAYLANGWRCGDVWRVGQDWADVDLPAQMGDSGRGVWQHGRLVGVVSAKQGSGARIATAVRWPGLPQVCLECEDWP